jgi:hypothetical protein
MLCIDDTIFATVYTVCPCQIEAVKEANREICIGIGSGIGIRITAGGLYSFGRAGSAR